MPILNREQVIEWKKRMDTFNRWKEEQHQIKEFAVRVAAVSNSDKKSKRRKK